MANLTAREQIVLNELLKRLALNNGFTEQALVGDVGTQLANATAGIAPAATELTIAAGVITITQSAHMVDTQSDDLSDDLDTISGGTAEQVLYLRPASGARTVVIKHNTGNIMCPGALDISLADASDFAVLVYANSKWTVVAYNTLAATLATLAGTQSFTGQKTFNHQKLRVANGGGTFSSIFESSATAARTVTLPNRSGTFEISSAPQQLSGAGAIDLTTRTTLFTSTGGAQAISMADGLYVGQRKTVMHVSDGGSGVISPDTFGSLTSVTLTNVRDWVEFEWDGLDWYVVGYTGATFT